MTRWCRHNSWWHMKCAQHTTQIPKEGIIQTSLVVVLEKINVPAHMVEGDHHLRKTPTPTHTERVRFMGVSEWIPHFKYAGYWMLTSDIMPTSLCGNIFSITGCLWGKTICDWCIPLKKRPLMQIFGCYLFCKPGQPVEQSLVFSFL